MKDEHEGPTDVHKLSVDELESKFNTNSENGLAKDVADANLATQGPNVLTPPTANSKWKLFAFEMFGGMSFLLWIGAIYCFGSAIKMDQEDTRDDLYTGCFLVVFASSSGLLSYFQALKSTGTIGSFATLSSPDALVVREGKKMTIAATNLTIGDLVFLKGGNKVPADLRVLTSEGLKVDNSPITGEKEPQKRSPDKTSDDPLETENIAFFGTNVLEGDGSGIVFAVGDKTFMGQIASLATKAGKKKTSPLSNEVNFLIMVISIGAFLLAFIFYCIGSWLLGFSVASIIFVGIIIANVPEGLLPGMTVVLTIAAKRMADKNALVKNLESIETLGNITHVCSDKTGTLTQNRMTASHFWFDNEYKELIVSDMKLKEMDGKGGTGWKALFRCIALCSRAEFLPHQDKVPVVSREVRGDASETGLLKLAERIHPNIVEWRNKNRKLHEVPFNSTVKYQLSVHNLEEEDAVEKQGRILLVMKGAPERILKRCDTILANDETISLNDEWKDKINDANYKFGTMGERVLGFADLWLDESQYGPDSGFEFQDDPLNYPMEGLRFLGLASMIDPPKSTVPNAIEKCQTAGIKVVMVTGDQPVTARAIAEKVGIVSKGSKTVDEIADERGISPEEVDPSEVGVAVISGDQLKKMSPEDLDRVLTVNELVFARTSPEQKLMIVAGCQRLGGVVAVTGDGVNDSPAMKKSNVGIAMASGSDVAKDAADIVLLDDNFATIVNAVEEGRMIFDNLKKTIAYVLTSNVPESLPFIMFAVLGIPLPIGLITVLLIDLGTDIMPSISLGFQEPESEMMKLPPRNARQHPLVSENLLAYSYLQIGMIQAAALFFTYLVIYTEMGFDVSIILDLKKKGWYNPQVNDLQDVYGQEWTFQQRKTLEYTVHTACFITIVITQIAACLVCSTRRLSLFQQNGNVMILCAFFFTIFLAAFFSYTPNIHEFVKTSPVKWQWWILPLPFVLLIIVYDEIRKLMIRSYPHGWTARELQW